MSLTFERITQRTKEGNREALMVSGCTGAVRDLVIPKEHDGLLVRSIAGHAFAHRKELRTVSLPESLQTIRSFAFYACQSLASLELFNTTNDYYDGVIRQCPSLRLITVHCVVEDDFVIVRDMLQDVESTLSFLLHTKEGDIRLTFPEYVNEAKEDTMARAIHFSIEGAGMAYRECVGRKKLDLSGYDRLLGRLTEYDFADAAAIALGRLTHPVGLLDGAKKGYEDFILENDVRVLEVLLRFWDAKEQREDLSFLCEQHLIGKEALEEGLSLCAVLGMPQISSILMEYRARLDAPKAAVLSLDWM